MENIAKHKSFRTQNLKQKFEFYVDVVHEVCICLDIFFPQQQFVLFPPPPFRPLSIRVIHSPGKLLPFPMP